MVVEICAVSGYSEFGKNMTAVRYNDEVVILDMGIHPENYIRFSEDEEDMAAVGVHQLVKVKAIPDISPIKDWKDRVVAIVPGHAHLDHCGAIVYLAGSFRAPVVCTPFTAEVVREMIRDRRVDFRNKVVVLEPNGSRKVSDSIKVEFIHATHSTPHSSMVAIHTPDGIVLYASDFKFDESPVLGKPYNRKRLKELGKENVIALIVESTYGNRPGRTPSESVAREMLADALELADTKRNTIIVTTFSSHLARLKSILELGLKHRRKVVFLGRSMGKYIAAGEGVNLINFGDKAEIVRFGSKVEGKLRQIEKAGKQNYLLVCTGHQGEPKSVLSRIITTNFLDPKDYVIFSCKTIPTPTNIRNRERLERELKRLGVHVLLDVHQSGHGAQYELLELIDMVKPKNVIPSHGDPAAKVALAELLKKNGYDAEQVHIAEDGDRVSI